MQVHNTPLAKNTQIVSYIADPVMLSRYSSGIVWGKEKTCFGYQGAPLSGGPKLKLINKL